MEVYQVLPMHLVFFLMAKFHDISCQRRILIGQALSLDQSLPAWFPESSVHEQLQFVAIPASELDLDHAISAWEAYSAEEVDSYRSIVYPLCILLYSVQLLFVWLYINDLQLALVKCSLTNYAHVLQVCMKN